MEMDRSLYYAWKKSPKNGKPGPKNPWWKLKKEVVEKVLSLKKEFEEIATNYVIAVKAGISASSVGKIWNEYFGPRKEEKERKTGLNACEWLKLHVCWSLDTIKIRCKEGYVYVQLLFEEYSRCVMGCVISFSNVGERAKKLIEETIEKHKTGPLVIKTDRGGEFVNETLERCLKEKRICFMPSPGHYPLFNGKLERENSIFRRFTEKKGVMTFEELTAQIDKAVHVVNHELPRMIFDGKTSADIFKKGEIYGPEEKEMLLEKVKMEIQKIKELKVPKLDELGILRKSVVKCVIDLGLCNIKSGEQNVNQFAG